MQRVPKRVLQTTKRPPARQPQSTTADSTAERQTPEFAGGWQNEMQPDLSQRVMHLQRAVGNAATLRQLKSLQPHSRTMPHGGRLPKALMPLAAKHVQRFASAEHRSLGVEGEDVPEGTLFEGSPALTYGEIIALTGDFYGSYDHLASEFYILKSGGEDRTPGSRDRKIAELNSLKHLFEIESIARANNDEEALEGLDTAFVPDLTATPGADGSLPELPGYELTTDGRYGELALQNFLHFSFGGENINAWKAGHKQAMIEAFRAGLNNDATGRIRAMARNAGSNHYLTDAFSSGHMRVPRRPADTYYRNLMVGAVDGLLNEIVEALPANISFSVPLSELNQYLPDWVDDHLPDIPDIDVDIPLPLRDWVRDAITPIANDLRPIMNDTVGPVLGGLVSKWLHDKENERGLCVCNPAGGIWQAFGDERLDQPGTPGSCPGGNTSNRAEAEKAVAADVAEVNRMFELGRQQAEEESDDDETTSIPSNIHFAFDRPRGEGDVSVLSGADRAGLDALANHLNSHTGISVNLTGWADSRGSDAYNVGLTSRRISTVRTYLEAQGVTADKFGAITPMGEPQVPTTEANHAQFRRVDIELIGTPEPTEPEPTVGEEPEPPGVDGPYDAEQYIPEVMDNNPVLEPYEWCEPEMDASLKNEVSAKARDMLGGLLRGKITANLPDNIPVDIEIPVPFFDNPHVEFEIPLRDWLSKVNDYVDPAVEAVLTNDRFNGILDGACSLAESATPTEE